MDASAPPYPTESTPPPYGWQERNTTCPPGLHWLTHLDRLYVTRELDETEESKNPERTYKILDGQGEHLFTATEQSSSIARWFFGKYHAWEFRIEDKTTREVIRLSRPLRCTKCCFPCCSEKVMVYANGKMAGYVKQNWNLWRPSFSIFNESNENTLWVKGPLFWGCGHEVDIRILKPGNRRSIGVIAKKWTGSARKYFRQENSLGLSFPKDLDEKTKAVLIGACILTDFLYYKDTPVQRRRKS